MSLVEQRRLVCQVCCAVAIAASTATACSEASELGPPTNDGEGQRGDAATDSVGDTDSESDSAVPRRPDASAPPSDAGDLDASDAALDAGPDGASLPQTPNSPRVVSSAPAEDEATYPIEKPPVGAYRKIITLVFDRPMDVSYSSMTLYGPNGDVRSIDGTWNVGGDTLSAEIPKVQLPAGSGGTKLLPLTYASAYRVDLSSLRSLAGDGVHATDAYLKDGALDFTTLPWDQLLEHTCGHTVDPVYQTLALTETVDAAPLFESLHTHKRFQLVLPGAGPTWAGHASLVPVTPRTYYAFVETSVPIQVVGPNGAIGGIVHGLPPHCSLRYMHEFRFDVAGTYDLAFGPVATSMFELYFERE